MVWEALLVTAQVVEVPNPDFSYAQAHTHHTTAEKYHIKHQDILIHYENNISAPRWDYQDNQTSYDVLTQVIEELASDSVAVHTLVIEGAASPVGSEDYNNALALRRAEQLKEIISKMEGGDKFNIHTISMGEDWGTFSNYIHKKYNEANREEVLAILDSWDSNDNKERRLYDLDNGKTWQLLVASYMGPARNAAVVRIIKLVPLADLIQTSQLHLQGSVKPLEFIPLSSDHKDNTRTSTEPSVIEPSVVEPTVADKIVAEPTPSKEPTIVEQAVSKESKIGEQASNEKDLRKPVFAFRSNLLVPALNVGGEVPIGDHWSVGADYYFPWIWPKRDNKNCFELLAWGIEGRYWFGRNRTAFDRLQGHSIGLYGYMGYYDFERNFHGHQGEFVNIGLDYTYAMAVGKRRQVHLEFSIGIGYIYSQAREYTVIEAGSPLISNKITKITGFFGPTKANISLVVPIFQKVKPQKREVGNE